MYAIRSYYALSFPVPPLQELVAGGWPFSWLGAASRSVGPLGAVAVLATMVVAAGVGVSWDAFNRGKTAGREEVREAAEDSA